jgi:hypothetical protein
VRTLTKELEVYCSKCGKKMAYLGIKGKWERWGCVCGYIHKIKIFQKDYRD